MEPTRYLLIYALTVLLMVSELLPLTLSALVGAALMVLFGVAEGAFTYEEALRFIDLDLIALLVAVMIVVEVVDRLGTFRYVAFNVVKRTMGRPHALFTALSLFSALTSLLLSDEAAILLAIAIIVSISRIGGLDPLPLSLASAIMVNLGGTGSLIGSVVNMALGLRAGFDFVKFASYLLPCEFMLYAVTMAFLYARYRASLAAPVMAELRVEVSRREALKGGLLLALLLASLIAASLLGFPESGAALAAALVALAATGWEPAEVFRRLDWDTVFFAGAFTVITEVLTRVRALEGFAEFTASVAGGSLTLATIFLLTIVTLASIFVENLAVALTFAPVVELFPFPRKEPLWAAVALGANLGGVGLPISSFVIVMTLGALRREGYNIDPWSIVRVSIPTTLLWLGFSAIYLLLRFNLL